MNACNTCNGAADIQHARISQYKNLQKQEVNHCKKGITKLKYGQNFQNEIKGKSSSKKV